MKNILIIIAALVLPACTVVPIKGSIGSPIEEVIDIRGPDYEIVGKRKGKRSYVWTVTEIVETPGGITLEKSKTEKRNNGWTVTTSSSVTIPTPSTTSRHTCRYGYNTRFDEKRSAWIVTSISRSGQC